MRRIAVLSRRRALPALVAGTLRSCGNVTAVWQGGWQENGKAPGLPELSVQHSKPDALSEGAVLRYDGSRELLVSCAHSASGLSIAADTDTADILVTESPCGRHRDMHMAVVIPSDSRRLRRDLAGSGCTAVCCGLSRTDTLTVSSVGSDRLLMALQRELTALNGDIIDPCELWAYLPPEGAEVTDALLAVAAALLCGLPPEDGVRLAYAPTPAILKSDRKA